MRPVLTGPPTVPYPESRIKATHRAPENSALNCLREWKSHRNRKISFHAVEEVEFRLVNYDDNATVLMEPSKLTKPGSAYAFLLTVMTCYSHLREKYASPTPEEPEFRNKVI